MKAVLLTVGKTDIVSIATEINNYTKRIAYYLPFSMEIIPDIKNKKNLSQSQQKQKEGEFILSRLNNTDYVVLLDEGGRLFDSNQFAKHIEKKKNTVARNLIFVVGGPYGFSEAVRARANEKISLSKMTFTHQMVRLIFVEQFYRAMTILNNEPYHHS
jgi:23S rRNA (pseudouridine1915-N3)-methyltransferase